MVTVGFVRVGLVANTKEPDPVSSVTAEMTKGMTANEIEILIADLDDAVMLVCQDYGIEG